jgi:acetylornithine deacetylase/succinyl-diaminopimelate desuccinylase-like protein
VDASRAQKLKREPGQLPLPEALDSRAVAAQPYVDELGDWLRIPSISAAASHAADVREAGEWICELVRRAGGACELHDWEGKPLAVGDIRASIDAERAPTVLVYGHFDVQPPEPLELWDAPPFEATIRDGWLYARGVADDKGQLYLLLKAAELLAADNALPVNIRIVCDGEEEIGGHSIVDFLAADDRGADVALIFDAPMVARDIPSINLGTRGLAYFHVRVRTGARDLHSGLYGGAALNANHALLQALSAVLPRDGRLPEPLRAGVLPPSDEEVRSWADLPAGADELAGQGARPSDAGAADEFYLRTWAEPSLDVHGLTGGEAVLQKTVLPVEAEANLSIRLAPGQSVDEIAATVQRLLRAAAPEGAEIEVDLWSTSPPGIVSPDEPAVELAAAAFERVFGRRPVLVRSGGTLPIVPALAERGIPTVLSGLALPDSNIHAPNERMPVDYLPRGIEVARLLYEAFATLPAA